MLFDMKNFRWWLVIVLGVWFIFYIYSSRITVSPVAKLSQEEILTKTVKIVLMANDGEIKLLALKYDIDITVAKDILYIYYYQKFKSLSSKDPIDERFLLTSIGEKFNISLNVLASFILDFKSITGKKVNDTN